MEVRNIFLLNGIDNQIKHTTVETTKHITIEIAKHIFRLRSHLINLKFKNE